MLIISTSAINMLSSFLDRPLSKIPELRRLKVQLHPVKGRLHPDNIITLFINVQMKPDPSQLKVQLHLVNGRLHLDNINTLFINVMVKLGLRWLKV